MWPNMGNMICSKTEVMNLLESAGFSRSNPYYVVQQGKVGAWFFYYWTLLLPFLSALWFIRHTLILFYYPSSGYLDCYIDSIIDIDERCWATGFTERNWWHSSLWGETTWKFENYARNGQVIFYFSILFFSFMYACMYASINNGFFTC